MYQDNYSATAPFIERPEYRLLQDDLVALRDEVEKDIKRFRATWRPLNADCSSVKSLLRTDWMFALVSMPCWIGHALGVRDKIRRRSLVGGYYIYHHLLALDHLIDVEQSGVVHHRPKDDVARMPAAEGHSLLLEIATALPVATSLAVRQFQYILESNSAFWDDFEHAYTVWAEAMYWEREVKSYRDLSLEYAMRMESGKCAPFCISSLALCRAGGHDDRIADVNQALTTTNMAMDLIDDYSDWVIDLAQGRFNSFVALAASHDLLQTDIPTFDEMLFAILHTPLLDLYVNQVCTLTAQTERVAASIGVELWLPLLTGLSRSAMQQRDAFRTGLVSFSNSLFEEE